MWVTCKKTKKKITKKKKKEEELGEVEGRVGGLQTILTFNFS